MGRECTWSLGSLGHVFDGKLYFTRDICEEKWIPMDLVPPKKSSAAPKARGKAALSQEQSQPPNGLVCANAAAKPAPCAIASYSSDGATHPVLVMQIEHVQQFKVCFSRTQKFFAVPFGYPITSVLHESRWWSINAKVASLVFCLLASVEGTTVCLGIHLQWWQKSWWTIGTKCPPRRDPPKKIVWPI